MEREGGVTQAEPAIIGAVLIAVLEKHSEGNVT